MHKLSMRWMVVTAISAVAPQAIAQTEPPPVDAAPGNPPAIPASKSSATDATFTSTGTAAAPASPTAATGQNKAWIEQLLPVDGLAELGVFTGLLFPSSSHNLQSQYAMHQSLSTAPELGVRGAYFPIKYVGGELEYMVGFSKTQTDNNGATLWALRAQVIGQYPAWRVTPFAVLGLGRMGVLSDRMGNDADPLFHLGVGAKAALTPSLLVRLDLRDNMTQKYADSNGSQTHSVELLVGVSLVLGRPREVSAVVDIDTDGDGLIDRADSCPNQAGVRPDGCPVRDRDGDGVVDSEDKCPEVRGNPPDGCPIIKDSDGDGIADDKDKCLETKGDLPDGCPANGDSDDDGILDSNDKCPNEAESPNGYEDTDGCPDELPIDVKKFTGILRGIEFDREKASLSASSLAALDKSAQVLADHPSLRVLITGHTDNTGGLEKNLQLSKARAEAVKAYFVSKGIDPTRIETRGAGSDEPLDSNATAAGRQSNRRIELKLLKSAE